MTDATHRSTALRGKPAVAETIDRPHAPFAMGNSASALVAVIAMANCALAVSVLTMGLVRILRCFVRTMGAAHELAQIEAGIVGNFSPTLTRSES